MGVRDVTLKLIQFLPTKLGAWKFLDEITLVKQSVLPKMSRFQPTPHLVFPKFDSLPSVFKKFYELDERLYEVQEIVDKLEYMLVQHTDMLDGIAHN